MDESKKKDLLSRLKFNLIAFGKAIFPRAFKLPSSPAHYEMGEALLGPDRFLNIIAPRGIAKSTLVGIIYVLHHIMFGPKGPKVVVLVSRTQSHAVNLLQSIKDILEYSLPFRALFGYWGIHSAKNWTASQIILKDGSAIICRGMGQMIRGINIGGQRPTLLILDDPEDENNTKTIEAMDSNLAWLIQGAEPSLDARIGKLVIIGTPLHERCIVWRLKDSSKYKTMHYSAVMVDDVGDSYSIWPEMFSLEELDRMREEARELGRLSAFYKERLCQIIGDDDQPFKAEDIQYWNGFAECIAGKHFLHITEQGPSIDKMVKFKEEKIIPVNIYIGVDPASSVNEKSDFSVIMVIAIDKEMKRYIVDYWRRRAKPMMVAEMIINKYKEYKPCLTQIESTGYQEMLRDYIKSTQIAMPGIEIDNKPRNKKSERLQSFQPLFAQKKVYLKTTHNEFRDELISYPRGSHEDTLDGFYYANKNASPPYHTIEERNAPKTKKKTFLNWKLS